MKKFFVIFRIIIVVCILIGGIYFKTRLKSIAVLAPDQTEKSQQEVSNNDLPQEQQEPAQTVAEKKTSQVVYPMDRFNERILLNPYGNDLSNPTTPKKNIDRKVCSKATAYSGFHNADDLEALDGEQNSDVPVKSIADGVVRQIGFVNGYGGLAVIENELDGKVYTVYYGHIDAKSSNLKTGDKVKAGQKIANLAPECSSANGNTRKHLHFSIHKGKSIDVKGYVATKNELSNWLDPKEFLASLI